MDKFSNIIIASDMDGTFMGSELRIVPENVDAVKYFTSNGGKFTIATGRTPVELVDMLPIASELVNAPVGCCNGLYFCELGSDKPLYEATIPHETLYRALKPFLQKRDFEMLIIHGNDFYGLEQRDFNFVAKYPDNQHMITPEDLKTLDTTKVVLLGEEKCIQAAAEKVMRECGNELDCVRSLTYAVEFIPKGHAKNIAIRELRKWFGEQYKIFAIGDYGNDIGMLRTADYAVCPANALPEVKEICDIQVCDNDHGAIADLIRVIEEKKYAR